MFYALSKLLPLLIYPAGLTCVLLVIALVLRRRERRVDRWIAAALLIIALSGNRIVSIILVQSLEWRVPPLPIEHVKPADAIVVLGGCTQEGQAPRPTHEIGEAGDRLLYAAHLYRKGLAPYVVVSGGYGPLYNPGELSEAAVMAELLSSLGVPQDVIVLEERSHNTYENAVYTYPILASHGWQRIILVTSALHMPRASAVFHRFDLDIQPAPTDYLVTYSDWAFYTQPDPAVQLMNLFPKAEYMEMTEKAMKEYVGLLIYALRGWIELPPVGIGLPSQERSTI